MKGSHLWRLIECKLRFGVIDFCCAVALFSSGAAQFSTSIPPSLASVAHSKCFCARVVWCHLFKLEISQHQNSFQTQNCCFWIVVTPDLLAFYLILFVQGFFFFLLWKKNVWHWRNHNISFEKLERRHFCPVGSKDCLKQTPSSSPGYDWHATA